MMQKFNFVHFYYIQNTKDNWIYSQNGCHWIQFSGTISFPYKPIKNTMGETLGLLKAEADVYPYRKNR